MTLISEPAVRLNPDFSVAQVDVGRRTVVMLYAHPLGGEPDLEPTAPQGEPAGA